MTRRWILLALLPPGVAQPQALAFGFDFELGHPVRVGVLRDDRPRLKDPRVVAGVFDPLRILRRCA